MDFIIRLDESKFFDNFIARNVRPEYISLDDQYRKVVAAAVANT